MITIEGYDPIMPNYVYTKNFFYKKNILTEVLVINKFFFPTEQQINEEIRKNIGEYLLNKKYKNNKIIPFNKTIPFDENIEYSMEEIFEKIPQKYLELFLAGSINLPTRCPPVVTQYISILSGTLNQEEYKNKSFIEKKLERDFGRFVQDNKLIFSADVKITKNKLPPKEEMDLLIRHKVTQSETLTIFEGNIFSRDIIFKKVWEVLENFYSARLEKEMPSIKDNSTDILEIYKKELAMQLLLNT
ncbi:MAG: hypothetical protein QXG86_01820 [Candidatus Woesearchaeota archaeon]